MYAIHMRIYAASHTIEIKKEKKNIHVIGLETGEAANIFNYTMPGN